MITPNSELSEDILKTALIEARGDLFIAATSLRISPIRMQRAISLSPLLSVALGECQKNVASDSNTLSAAVDSAIAQRLAVYRVVGLDSLAELATMPIDENSAQNQVRLAAAARLAGSPEHSSGGGEMGDIMRSLNDAYHANAPRIRVTRERMTVEVGGGEKLINDIPPTLPPA